MTAIVQAAPIAVDSDTAAAMLGGIGQSTFLQWVSRGVLPRPRKLGARSMWLVSELAEAALRLPTEDGLAPPTVPFAIRLEQAHQAKDWDAVLSIIRDMGKVEAQTASERSLKTKKIRHEQ